MQKDNFHNRFLEFIEEKNLILPKEKVLLTVSGGMDSSVMAYLFSQSGIDFGIAHCNFQLRGKESDGDEKFVNALAKKYKKQFHTFRFDTENYSKKNKLSIQEAARMLRYEWFEKIASENNYKKVATAHHLDDSIETFFINLMRGTGTAGLKGISTTNKKIIRPLLFATRGEIEVFASKNKISYREDSSNASDDYLRNRIRHHIIPSIKENSEGFESNMQKLMAEISIVHEITNDRLNQWKKKYSSSDKNGNTLLPLDVIRLDENPSAFLSLLLHSYGINGIESEKILAAETPGKIFHDKKYTLLRDRDYLIIHENVSEDLKPITINQLPAKIMSGNFVIKMNSDLTEKFSTLKADNKFVIDQEKIKLPLVLRTWKPGDYFFPLGMKGKKKISDFYTDNKIDRFEKNKIYLLLSGNDIVCILGHRIDDRFKITSKTKKILSIELSNS